MGEKLPRGMDERERRNELRRLKSRRVFHFSPAVSDARSLERLIAESSMEEHTHCVLDVLKHHAFGLQKSFAEISVLEIAQYSGVSTTAAVRAIERCLAAGILVKRRRKA